MKDRVARYYATARAWYAYDAALVSKIGQPENLFYIFANMLFQQFTLFANWCYSIRFFHDI